MRVKGVIIYAQKQVLVMMKDEGRSNVGAGRRWCGGLVEEVFARLLFTECS